MEGDHRAEVPDSGEERRCVTMPLKCIVVSLFRAVRVLLLTFQVLEYLSPQA